MMHGRIFIWIVIFAALIGIPSKQCRANPVPPTTTTPSPPPPDGKLAFLFPPDSAELPPSELQRLDDKCRQLAEYVAANAAAHTGKHYFAWLGGHADVREHDADELVKRRRAAVERALSRCTIPINLCAGPRDQQPGSDGDALWHKVIFVKTLINKTDQKPVHPQPDPERAVPVVSMLFQPDSDKQRAADVSQWGHNTYACSDLKKALINWQRGLFITAYSSSEEPDAQALAARRAQVALRMLTETCHLDAKRLFPVAMPPVSDPAPKSQRRRVDLQWVLRKDSDAATFPFCWRLPVQQQFEVLPPPPAIFFEKNVPTLHPGSVSVLRSICRWLEEVDNVLELRGYAAPGERGQDRLPQQRAAEVQKQLVSCGLDPDRIRTKKRDPATPPKIPTQGQVELFYIP